MLDLVKFKSAGLALLLAVFGAPPGAAIEMRNGDTLVVDETFTDMVFLSGGEVAIAAEVSDDVFASGGEVAFNGASADHVFAAGGELAFNEATVNDIFAAGGEISLSGTTVLDDLVAVGGTLSIVAGNSIGGTVLLSGGDIVLDATVGGDVQIRGGDITIDGEIAGNADLTAGKIKIGPNARIGGNLRHRADWIEIDGGAVISGQTIAEEPESYDDLKDGAIALAVAASVVGLMILIGTILVVLVIAGFFGGFMRATDAMIRRRTLVTIAVGFLTFILVPLTILILFATVVGIPLAFLLIAFLIAAYPLGVTAAAHGLGMAMRGLIRRVDAEAPGAGARVLWSLIGIIALIALGAVPFIGGVVWLIALVIGFGAAVATLYAALAEGRSAEAAA